MFLVMGVTLFTSRIVLEQLGVDDYGIFSVIGGVIILFTFASQAMSTASQRFITFELGKKDGSISVVFGTCLMVHLIMIGIVFILAESVGLWFLNSKMNFPKGTEYIINWTYQFTILNCLVSIYQFPYNALVCAHEEMNFFAYTSIVEVLLKLGVAYSLSITEKNKLEIYVVLLLVVSIILLCWYILYCKYKFRNINYVPVYNKTLILDISKFSGWAILGSTANLGFQQGINILINLFYGVTINAAVGIANQVSNAINRFVSGFQQALNPQLIKTEASKAKERQTILIETSSKFSFFIMLFIATPIIINLNYIVNLWLTDVPPLTVPICRLIIIGVLIETLSGPLWVTIFATGKIKRYQLMISFVLLLNLPLGYVFGKLHYPPQSIFVIRIVLFIIALIVRLLFLRKLIGLRIWMFFKNVMFPIIFSIIFIFGVCYLTRKFLTNTDSINKLLGSFSCVILIQIIGIGLFGLNKLERRRIISFIRNKIF